MNETLMDKIKRAAKNVRKFCWWSAGVVPGVLEKCPTNQIKYTAIGVVMVFIGVLGSVSFAFFLSQTFSIPFVFAWFIGIFWGILVYSLDRLVLTSFRKDEASKAAVIQRFVLTIALSLIISEPLLIYMFRKEIALEMARKSQTVAAVSRENASARFQTEIDSLETADKDLETRLEKFKTDRDARENSVIGEIEGISGSGKRGKGIAAERKDAAFLEADAKYKELKAESAEILSNNRARLAEIRSQIETETKNIAIADRDADGVLAKHEALFNIVKSRPGAALVYLPLLIGLLFLETLPLSVKVFGKKSVYDAALEATEDETIGQIDEEKVFRKKMQTAVAERISEAIVAGRIADLNDENEQKVAEKLKAEILRNIERRAFYQSFSEKSLIEFGPDILVEVVGNEDLQVKLQLPENVRREISLTDLSGDILNIAAETGEENLKLAKAFTSKNHEIWEDLPLLPQLEGDRKLILQFEPEAIT